MARRIAWGLGAALAVATVALAAAVVFRAPLLEAALLWGLRGQGLAHAALGVRTFDLGEIRLSDVRLDRTGTLGAQSVRLTYSPRSLLAGRLDEIDVDGLTLTLDLRGGGPMVADLPQGTRGAAAPVPAPGGFVVPAAVPPVTITNGRILARTALGDLDGRFEAAATPDGAGNLAALASFDLKGPPGQLSGAVDGLILADGSASATLSLNGGWLAKGRARLDDLRGQIALARAAPGGLQGTAEIAATPALDGAALGPARLTLALEDARAEATFTLGDFATLNATVADLRAKPRLSVRADLTGRAEGPPWALAGLPAPSVGTGTLRIEAEGPLPALGELARLGDLPTVDLAARLADGVAGRWAVKLDGLSFPAWFDDLAGAARGRFAVQAGTAQAWLGETAQVRLGGFAPAWLQARDVPAPLAPLLAHGAALALEGPAPDAPVVQVDWRSGEGTIAGTLRGTLPAAAGAPLGEIAVAGRAAGTVAAGTGDAKITARLARFALGDATAEALVLRLPASVTWSADTLAVRARGPGQVAVGGLWYGTAVSLASPLAVAIETADARLARGADGPGAFTYGARLAPRPFGLTLPREGAQSISLKVAGGRLSIRGQTGPKGAHGGRIDLADGRVEVPARQVALDGVAATLAFGAPGPAEFFTLTTATARHLATPPVFTPLTLTGRVQRGAHGLAFSLDGTAADPSARVQVRGRHAPGTGRGDLEARLGPLAFAPGGLQPGALAPALATLKAANGRAEASARLRWQPGALTGTADLALNDISFEAPEAAVEGLSGTLHLESLFPPASAPGQRLTVRRIDPGVGLEDIAVSYGIAATPRPRLEVAEAAFSIAGGRVRTRDLVLDPAAPRQVIPLEIDGLDLAEAFDLLNVDGLSGDGRLSGTIPVVADATGIEISGGRLDAAGPGRLRFDSEAAKRVLASAGDSADLMLRALRDFRYDKLSLTLDEERAGTARLGLMLLGNNPRVLDGYPFRFNINLETNPIRLMGALREAYRISNRALRRLWMPGP